MKNGLEVTNVRYGEGIDKDYASKCRKNKIPATGVAVKKGEQLAME